MVRKSGLLEAACACLILLSLFPVNAFPRSGASSLVRIPYKGPRQANMLYERGIDVIHVSPRGYMDVAADPEDLEYLFSLGYPISVIAESGMALSAPALDQNLGLYHTYAETESTLLALESQYPELASVEAIGTSGEGRIIYALKISDNVAIDESEPEVLIMGNHHARELMSVEIPLLFAEYLLDNYESDPAVASMVDEREIYIIPMVNPDGHVFVELNHSGDWWTWWRKNRRDNLDGSYGVDLNRNYGYLWGYDNFGSSPSTFSEIYRGSAAFSEPETQAIRDFVQSRSFIVGFSYHSYGDLLLYPWSYNFTYTADHRLFNALGDTLVASNGYLQGNSATGAIYLVNGDSDDWAYGETTTKEPFFNFSPEVNTSAQGGFGPPETLIGPTFDLLLPMNMLLLELADNPWRILGPFAPAMYPVYGTPQGSYVVRWSAADPADPNPAVSYDVLEYKNFTTAVDHADTLCGSWEFGGFSLNSFAYEGTGSYFSQTGNNLSQTLTTKHSFTVTVDNDSLLCWVYYNIESNWDYVYVEVSTDGGLTWAPIPGNLTTNANPNGSNHGNGMTGTSTGWVPAKFPLTAYLGENITLRFHYITDGAVYGPGFYVDLINQAPVFDSAVIAGSAVADTFLAVMPLDVGTYTYVARAHDAEGQSSLWSNAVTHTVDQIVGAGEAAVFAYGLGRNYPNPFNPATTIPYSIGGSPGSSVRVTLSVYTVEGKLVTNLVDEPMGPGSYRARWNGRDAAGRDVSSGVYFVRLTADGAGRSARKIVLLK
jgi:murein tripeptide amidase MpaA